MTLRTIRIGLWVAVIALALIATAAYFLVKVPASQGGLGGGQYSLSKGDGTPFTQASLIGQPSMLFFGYTHCPDVCPTTLSEMAAWYEQLGDAGKPLRAYFVTVDPTRDTAAIVNDYAHAVSDRIDGVTGPQAEIDKMVAAWKVYVKLGEPDANGEYFVDHTASVFLVDSQGQFQGTIAYGESGDTAVQKLKLLLSKG